MNETLKLVREKLIDLREFDKSIDTSFEMLVEADLSFGAFVKFRWKTEMEMLNLCF